MADGLHRVSKSQPLRTVSASSFKAVNHSCSRDSPCHARIASISQQVKDASYRYEQERNARLQLDQKYEKLSQQNVDLHQQNNVYLEGLRNGDETLQRVQQAYHQSQQAYSQLQQAYNEQESNKRLIDQDRTGLQRSMKQQAHSSEMAEQRLQYVFETTRTLAQAVYVFTLDTSNLSEEQKQEQRHVDYASVLLERDTLKRECDGLKAALVKERNHALFRFGNVQGKTSWQG